MQELQQSSQGKIIFGEVDGVLGLMVTSKNAFAHIWKSPQSILFLSKRKKSRITCPLKILFDT